MNCDGEKVAEKAIQMITGLETLTYKEKLKRFAL